MIGAAFFSKAGCSVGSTTASKSSLKTCSLSALVAGSSYTNARPRNTLKDLVSR